MHSDVLWGSLEAKSGSVDSKAEARFFHLMEAKITSIECFPMPFLHLQLRSVWFLVCRKAAIILKCSVEVASTKVSSRYFLILHTESTVTTSLLSQTFCKLFLHTMGGPKQIGSALGLSQMPGWLHAHLSLTRVYLQRYSNSGLEKARRQPRAAVLCMAVLRKVSPLAIVDSCLGGAALRASWELCTAYRAGTSCSLACEWLRSRVAAVPSW